MTAPPTGLRRHLTYANIVATICLAALLGGGVAYASDRLPKDSVTSKQIKNGTIKKKDLSKKVAASLTPAAAPAGVPPKTVAFFNLAACPSGWSELAAARGRYLVGLNPGGQLGASQGVALGDVEDRPVGQHTHGVNDPGHQHGVSLNFGGDGPVSSTVRLGSTFAGFVGMPSTGLATTGVTVQPAGAVAGTNAPYLQLLTCMKS